MKKKLVAIALLVLFLGSFSATAKDTDFKAEICSLKPFTYMCYEGKGPYTEIPVAEAILLADFAASGLKAADKEITIYWNSPFYVLPANLSWEIGFPVTGSPKNTGRLKAKVFPYKKVAVALHIGPYTTTYLTINALYKWIAANGYQTIGGPCVERYLNDIDNIIPDVQKKTEIWIPVK